MKGKKCPVCNSLTKGLKPIKITLPTRLTDMQIGSKPPRYSVKVELPLSRCTKCGLVVSVESKLKRKT